MQCEWQVNSPQIQFSFCSLGTSKLFYFMLSEPFMNVLLKEPVLSEYSKECWPYSQLCKKKNYPSIPRWHLELLLILCPEARLLPQPSFCFLETLFCQTHQFSRNVVQNTPRSVLTCAACDPLHALGGFLSEVETLPLNKINLLKQITHSLMLVSCFSFLSH